MSAITAAEINKLRQATGAGMMDCRKALTETTEILKLRLIGYVSKVKKWLQNVATVKQKKVL